MKMPTPGGAVPVALVSRDQARRSYAEARQSPCLSCSESPCCTHLPLHTFQVRTLLELDHAIYLLNFENIVVGISATGDWSAYYHQPCRFLDAELGCSLHDTPEQPKICVHYNPYACWYKKVLTVDVHDDFVRLDHRRVQWLLEHVSFDDENAITEVPEWDALVEAFRELPLQAPEPRAPRPAEPWQPVSLGAASAPVPFSSDRDPCTGCDASCCTTLVFPASMPTTVSSLDYLKFCLGFPGVELGIHEGNWSLVVKTSCRHLDGNRCGVYGMEERPLLCRYYDAWKCTYRGEFSTETPEGFLRVRFDQFGALAAGLHYDSEGALAELPPLAELKHLVESAL